MKRWIIWLLLTAAVLTGCAAQDTGTAEDGYLVYYVAQGSGVRGSDVIRACSVPLDLPEDATLRTTAKAVVEQLLRAPADPDLFSPFPDGVTLQSLDVRNRQAIVDLSGDILQLDGVDLSLADYCLTLTLTALEGVDAVLITADRRMIAQQPKQVFFERDVLLSNMDDVLKTVDVTLYFVNETGALTGEDRTLELYEGQTVAENLVVELLAGPVSRELTSVIPEGFQIHTVRVDSGVCYVNLPGSALQLLPGDQTVQWQILWSLAESLYSIETVSELRFLVDGEELVKFGTIPLETVAARPKG